MSASEANIILQNPIQVMMKILSYPHKHFLKMKSCQIICPVRETIFIFEEFQSFDNIDEIIE